MLSSRARVSGLGLLLVLGACAGSAASKKAEPAPAPPKVVATVDAKPITVVDVEEQMKRGGQDRRAARDELVELLLLRRAAELKQVALPKGFPAPAARARLEHELARALGVDVAPVERMLVVDHAWIKDAKAPKARAQQRKDLERLRARVAGGESIPKAFSALGFDGKAWHIGDHERYGYEVVPAEAHDLAAGQLSPIIPGDGGLHLFQIFEQVEQYPPVEAVREALRIPLREGRIIELND